ncbi:MAG: hypothetical protein WKH64_04335 [Chloroflexia bacterium]
MSERFDIDEILSRNEQIDLEKLEEGRELLRRLRERGLRRKGYDLATPYGGRRVTVQDRTGADDPRLVRLRRPRSAV